MTTITGWMFLLALAGCLAWPLAPLASWLFRVLYERKPEE